MAKNTGKAYENFVKTIQETILNLTNSDLCPTKRMTVELNKIINGREFDLYWEFEYGGIKYRNVIECKDYTTKISIGKIDEFLGRTKDIPDLRLIYATKTGYQSGAKERAEKYNISLLIVRECNDKDFVTEDGNQYLKSIIMTMQVIFPPRIISFNPIINISSIENQSHLNEEILNAKLGNALLNNSCFICNEKTGDQYSITELSNSLHKKIPNMEYNKKYSYHETLKNSFMKFKEDNLIIKISGYNLTCILKESIELSNCEVNFTEQILGIIQNSITNQKQMIFKDGNVMHLD